MFGMRLWSVKGRGTAADPDIICPSLKPDHMTELPHIAPGKNSHSITDFKQYKILRILLSDIIRIPVISERRQF